MLRTALVAGFSLIAALVLAACDDMVIDTQAAAEPVVVWRSGATAP